MALATALVQTYVLQHRASDVTGVSFWKHLCPHSVCRQSADRQFFIYFLFINIARLTGSHMDVLDWLSLLPLFVNSFHNLLRIIFVLHLQVVH